MSTEDSETLIGALSRDHFSFMLNEHPGYGASFAGRKSRDDAGS